MNPIRATRTVLALAVFACVLVAPAFAAGAAPDDSVTWSKGTQWISLRAGYAKSTAGGAADGNLGGGIGYSRFITRHWALGAYVHDDLLGKFGGSAEIEMPVTVEFVRHSRWGSAFHPYVGLGGGIFRHRFFRTGDDVTSSHGTAYLTFGANTSIAPGRVLGFDFRVAGVSQEDDNPVFRRFSTPFGYVPGAGDPAPIPLKGNKTHWSAKLNYSFTL
jgi:hypothetical protein